MKQLLFTLCVALTLILLPQHARSAELLTNGSFDTGDFTGWTRTNAAGSWMDWQNNVAGAGGGFNPPYVTAPQHGTRSVWNGITATANQEYTMYQQVTLPAGTASLSWRDRVQMNLQDFCMTAAACGSAFYFVEITNTSNVILQTLYSVTAPPLTKTDTGWRIHHVNLNAYAGQTIRIRFRDYATQTFTGPGQAEIDAVSLQSPALTTQANVAVSGRVTSENGRPISRATVTITDGAGLTLSAVTSPLGYYRFDSVAAGVSYMVTVGHKQYVFTGSPRTLMIADDFADLDFTGTSLF